MTEPTNEAYEELRTIQARYRVGLMRHWSLVLTTQYNSVITQHWFPSQEEAQKTHDDLIAAMQEYKKYDLNDDKKVFTFQTLGGCSSVRVADVQIVAINPPEDVVTLEETDG